VKYESYLNKYVLRRRLMRGRYGKVGCQGTFVSDFRCKITKRLLGRLINNNNNNDDDDDNNNKILRQLLVQGITWPQS